MEICMNVFGSVCIVCIVCVIPLVSVSGNFVFIKECDGWGFDCLWHGITFRCIWT